MKKWGMFEDRPETHDAAGRSFCNAIEHEKTYSIELNK